jgi:hypothetical protein
MRNTRKFLEWIPAKTASKLLVKMKGEILMLLPMTADGFRATIGALRSLGEKKRGEFSHLLSPDGPMRAPVAEKLRQAHV